MSTAKLISRGFAVLLHSWVRGIPQIVLVLNMGRLRGANAKCVQLKYAIEVDRCRYRKIAQPEKYCCGFIRDRLCRPGRRCFRLVTLNLYPKIRRIGRCKTIEWE